jgi:hypothetical protein
VDEILPGIFHWAAFHEGIRHQVHSCFVAPAATLIDPMVPPEGIEWFTHGHAPDRIVLTNRHHYRHSDRFAERFACPVLCHESGLHEFAGRPGRPPERVVAPFAFGDELAPGIRALEVGAICPEETALHIDHGGGALAFADGLIRRDGGELAFVSDALLGDDAERVKAGLRSAFARLVEECEFDTLILAHGSPMVGGGREALRAFAGAG